MFDNYPNILYNKTKEVSPNFEVISSKNIYVESDTGSISGKIHGDKAQYSISVDVELGRCNVKNQTGTSDKVLEISNDTGSANIEFVQ